MTNPSPSISRAGIRRVLLATDLSAASEAATLRALGLAADLGASVLVVSVIDARSLRLPGGAFSRRVDQVRAVREAAVRELVARGRAFGVRVDFLIWQGEPGEAIVEAATAEQVDLIIVGSHGRGAVSRFLIGSVSDHVVRNAPAPVLVVRPATEAATSGLAPA